MRIALIYDPKCPAGRLRRINRLAQVLEARGHVLSRHDSIAFRFESDAADAGLLCICGGDGTARLVIEAQQDLAALPPLAIYPAGTINLLARELNYPADPLAFAACLESASPDRPYMVAMVGERRFLACASLGPDAWAVAAAKGPLKARIGRFAYVLAMLGQLRNWPRHRLRITADGRTFDAEALFVLRGAFYAGPWTLDLQASLGNTHFRLLALPRAGRRDMLALALFALTGGRRAPASWHVLDASVVDVETESACPVQADGDIVAAAPLRFRMTGDCVRWASP